MDEHTRTIAFAVVILDNYWAILYTEPIYSAYVTGSEATQVALTAPGAALWIDVKGWFAYGAVSLWTLVISVLALHGKVWPKGLAYFGIVGAFTYFLVVASVVVPNLFISGAIIVVSVIGAILAPIWFTWVGSFLRHYSRQAST